MKTTMKSPTRQGRPWPSLLLASALVLAGCLGPTGASDDFPEPDVVLSGRCPVPNGWAGIHCDGDTLRIGPLELEAGEGDQKYGILLTGLETDVIIEGVSIVGFPVGIQIEGGTCPSCVVEVRDSHIVAAVRGVYRTYPEHAPHAFRIQDTVIESDGTGVFLADVTDVTISNVTIAAARPLSVIGAEAVTVTDANLTSVAKEPFSTNGVDKVSLHRVQLSSPDAAGQVYAESISLNDVTVDTGRSGLMLRGEAIDIDASTFHVEGPDAVAYVDCPSTALCIDWGTAQIRDSTFSGAADYGLYAPRYASVDAAENWWGSTSGPTFRADGTPRLGSGGQAVPPWVVVVPWLEAPPAG